jgi:glycosyltransferase involved in cell wall biosynthesis
MRTLILTDTSLWGGLETHAAALAQTLADAGHRVTILCLDARACDLFRRAVPPAVEVAALDRPPKPTLRGWLRALRGIEADGVLLEKGTLNTGSFALDCALRFKFARYVTYQQLEPPRLPPKSSKRYLGGLMPGLGLWWYRWRWSGYARSIAPQATICVSDAALQALASDYGFSKRKLVTIRHGVDVQRFRPDPALRAGAREVWGIPENAFVFGTVRRFVHDKGLDVLIEAFAQLRSETDADVRLVLIGDGPERDALVSLAKRLGVDETVVFPGFTPSPWTVYPGFDVFVIPSRIEALGVVVIEAMASACFVIASRVGGIPEMISDPSLGTLVPPEDPAALCQAMEAALRLPSSDMAQHLRRARQHVSDNFHLETQSMKIAALLTSGGASRRGA